MGIIWTIIIGFVAGVIAKFLYPEGPTVADIVLHEARNRLHLVQR